MTSQAFDLAADAVERWVQELGPQQASQALIGFGLWRPAGAAAPTDDLDAAYDLARRVLGLDTQAIAFRSCRAWQAGMITPHYSLAVPLLCPDVPTGRRQGKFLIILSRMGG